MQKMKWKTVVNHYLDQYEDEKEDDGGTEEK